jgi:D-arabinose 1-dehydrogenase-like Zn-dependent alcohol dehydrogenase
LTDDERELARYQAALLEVLASAERPEDALRALHGRAEIAPFAGYVGSFEPRCVEVGMRLVKQWGGRSGSVVGSKGARPADAVSMNAAVLGAVGGVFEQRDLPIPDPGPGQVRIRVQASGVCGTDVHIWRGDFPVPLPIVLGHEPVGTVDKVGLGVAHLQDGDRVGVCWAQAGCGRCLACERGAIKYCPEQRSWIHNGGGHSEWMIAETTGCARLPDGLGWEEAAPMFCAGFTVMSGYRNARPRAGDRIAVLGIGGLGHLAVQIAEAYGHEVIAVTSSEGKRREAKELGAADVLVVRHHAGEELAAMGGADVILATSSAMEVCSQALAGLRPGGRLVSMGIGRGAITIDPMLLLSQQISIVGSMQDDREDLIDVLDLVARGRVKPRLEVYPMLLVNQAMSRLVEGRVRYRAVLVHEP